MRFESWRALGWALALALAAPSAGAAVAAAEAPFFPPAADHDPAVPTFERILGYAVGERMTDDAGLRAYLQALSQGPGRILQRTYGKTHEGRLLRYLAISHPDNLARLDQIRENNRRLADPRRTSSAEAADLARDTPVTVWLAYGVHGNENSSTEAALALAYHLAAARDEETLRMLRDAVVIIDPVQNPDGRERFITYERQIAAPAPRTDPYAIDHDEPWPSGRFNHYLFDLNRDWFFATQPETRGKVAAFLDWMPQVYVDFHEMGSDATYYFAPPAEPINENIPGTVRGWWETFGRGNAAAFDRAGFDYYTAESFDGYYPGYGDSWPTLHGSIGMTYEQASARGLAVQRRDGTTLTLREAARHHFEASIATIATAAAHRERLLGDFYRIRGDAVATGESGPVRAYLIASTPAPTATRLVRLLIDQGIEVLRSGSAFDLKAAGYDGGRERDRRFPAGTFIVPLAQPAGRLASALMERDPRLTDEFIADETDRRRRGQDTALYDVTSWSLPLVTGAEAWWTGEVPRVGATPVSAEDLARPGRILPIGPAASGAKADYAYLLRYDGNASAMAEVSLLRAGLKVRVAGRAFRMGPERFGPGTVVLRVHGNPDSIHEIVRGEAETFGVDFYAVSTGLTDEGADLGSSTVAPVDLPRVAVAYGEPVSPGSVGAIAYLFEAVYGLPFTPVRVGTLTEADLSRYNVIILPDERGSPGYREYLGEAGLARLKSWMDLGGTLVTLKGASAYVTREEVGLTSVRRRLKPRPETEAATAEPVASRKEDRPADLPDEVPGASLRVAIDTERYLAFGYGKEGVVMVNSKLAFSPTAAGHNVVTFAPKDRLRVAGYALEESLDLLAGAAYLVEEPRGRGRLILFADDPGFRGYWESLHRMLLNAVVLSPSFGGR